MREPEPKEPVQDAAKLLQLVMDNIPQFIFWKNRDSVYLGCNQNFADAAGVKSPAEIVGKTDFDLAWKSEEAEFFREVDRRVMDANIPEYGIVEPQLQADGREAWLRTNKIPLHDSKGEVVGILGTFEDITEQKLAEEERRQLQRMESIGQLAGGVAHDFNNMLTAIINAAEFLERAPDGEKRRDEMLGIILKTSDRAAELTRKLLAFSRQGQLERRPLDVHAVILDAVGILERSIDRRIRLDLALGAERSVVEGDASELTAMVMNLGINARDAIEGEGIITIATTLEDLSAEDCEGSPFALKAGTYLAIQLSDTGEGIDEAVGHRIFEPFFTTKSRGSGTGLGLAAAYGTAVEHAGSIAFSSERGEGTRFRIRLPLSTADVAAPIEIGAQAHRGEGTLLVIDDEGAVRHTTKTILERLGYEALTAENGRVGLEVFAAHRERIDAIILDMVMPEMGGAECLRALRLLDEELPVIISSGYSREDATFDDLEGSPPLFLKKPYRLEELADVVARALEGR